MNADFIAATANASRTADGVIDLANVAQDLRADVVATMTDDEVTASAAFLKSNIATANESRRPYCKADGVTLRARVSDSAILHVAALKHNIDVYNRCLAVLAPRLDA